MTDHLHALAMRTKAARTAEYLRDVSGRNQDGDFYVGEEAACFAGSVADEIVSEILALPLESDHAALVREAVKLPEIAALIDAVSALGLRKLVAGWNGENREKPYATHPPRLGVTLKTNAGTVYAIDAALIALDQPE